jgi:hypothetical protein
MAPSIAWKEEPDDHDYPAAASYLSLVVSPPLVEAIVAALRDAPISHFQVKDILRASGLPLLPADDVHVAKDIAKVKQGHQLPPVLLVRGSLTQGVPLQIVDGYHRVCASYHLGEDSDVPCRITELPTV